MDIRLERKRDLETYIVRDYDILKEIEDDLRYEEDPIRKERLRRQNRDLSTQITRWQQELESVSSELRGTATGLANEVRDYLTLAGWQLIKDLATLPDGKVELLVEQRKGVLYQKVLVLCTTDEADYNALQRLRMFMSERDVPYGWLIAESRVDTALREQLDADSKISILSLDEFFSQLFPLDNYFDWLLQGYLQKHIDEYYVDLACTKATFDEEGREIGNARWDPADAYIDRWLDDHGKNHISILGDFGTGKTWFCWHYAYKQMKRYLSRPTRERIPILVSLRDFTKTLGVQQLFSDFFFRIHKIDLMNYSVFEELNRRGKFLIIFDGFDEMAQRVDDQTVVNNFWSLADVVVPGSKVILTCRTRYFRSSHEAFNLLHNVRTQSRIVRGDHPRFEILNLLDFDKVKTRAALSLRVGETKVDEIEERIRKVRDLRVLARKPIMVDFILQALPELPSDLPINPALMYHIVTDKWLSKNTFEGRTILDKWDKMFFAMELAWEMIGKAGPTQLRLHYSELPDRIRLYLSERNEEATKLEHLDYDLRTQSFLVSDSLGNYEFAHRSLAEYFVALKLAIELGTVSPEYLADILQEKKPAPRAINELLDTFGGIPLPAEVAEFLSSMMSGVERLWTLIEWTRGKTFDETRYLGGNAVTVLKLMHENFEEKDLSHTVLVKADFSHANLRRANLNGADLTGANLNNVILEYASCTNTNFAQVDVEEWGAISAITAHPSGDNIAISIFDAVLKIWEIGGAWRQIGVTRPLPHAPICIDYNCSGKLLACGHWDGTLVVWDRETGQKLLHFESETSIYSVAFSCNEKYLATSDRRGTIRIYDTNGWGELFAINGQNKATYCIQFSPDSRYLAAGSVDGTINIFMAGTWQLEKTLTGNFGYVRCLCYSPDGSQIASAGGGHKVILWNIETGEPLQILEGHTDGILTVDWMLNGEWIASAGLDNTIILWNAHSGKLERHLKSHTDTVFAVQFTPDNKYLISGGGDEDPTIRVWDMEGNCVKILSQASWKGADLNGAKGFETDRLTWLRSRTSRGWETDTPEYADMVDLVSANRTKLEREEILSSMNPLSQMDIPEEQSQMSTPEYDDSSLLRVDDYSFRRLVLDSTVPVLVEFSTCWCGPSRREKSVLEELALECKDSAIIAKMDIDESYVVPHSFNIVGIPTSILFVEGQIVHRHVGWAPKWALKEMIDAVTSN